MPKSAPSNYEMFASTAPGLESIAAGELNTLKIRGRQEIGGVGFGGDLQQLYEANLWLRTASRVVVRLGEFHASTFSELERRAKKLAWAKFLPVNGTVRLRVTCRKSKLYHSDAVAERVLSAIAGSASRAIDVTRETSDDDGTEAVPEPGAGAGARAEGTPQSSSQLFIVRIVHDQCEISADSSGVLLHRRGYRQEIAKAPLRETIAAAMILASGWKRNETLLDPMCGSGTIPIEAALIARRIAPGSRRHFQFMDWPGFEAARWSETLGRAQAGVTAFSGEIIGADRDVGAIEASTRNAERAGVADDVRFLSESVSASVSEIDESNSDSGWILTNPPYGIRVGAAGDLRNLYATLGTALQNRPQWRLGVLTSDSALLGPTKLALRPRFTTSNGGIPVGFYASEKSGRKTTLSRVGEGGIIGNE
jgi:putative N6-adenine-specific DNA methylase